MQFEFGFVAGTCFFFALHALIGFEAQSLVVVAATCASEVFADEPRPTPCGSFSLVQDLANLGFPLIFFQGLPCRSVQHAGAYKLMFSNQWI